jgi:proton glutamate symport protein
MNPATGPGRDYSLKALSRSINRPSVTLAAIALALVLGAMQFPFLQYLRPIGDFYIALLRICVLPFLLATIPLAVRSAMVSGSAGAVVRSLIIWLLATVVVVAVASIIVTSLIFHYASPDEDTIANIGALVGRSAHSIDVEFAVDPIHAIQGTGSGGETGIFAVIPTNIFASLSSNDSVRVLIFAAIFGLGMVMTERESGHSIFGALQHIQAVCIRIFDWFSLLVPIGIVALIAPQVALLGPDAFVVLALFAYAFLATSLLLLSAVVLTSALSLQEPLGAVFAALLRPIMLGASTRNTLICIPIALETLKDDLKIKSEPCDLYIPIGFATIRFGTVLYFVTATLFIGTLMGRTFSPVDLSLVGAFSVGASFATLGLSGVAALAPLALVLRPFGLSYEIAVPLMIIVDPIADMIRVMLNVAINCMIPTLAVGRDVPHAAQTTS